MLNFFTENQLGGIRYFENKDVDVIY